jgi:cephalosporin hydroxylase
MVVRPTEEQRVNFADEYAQRCGSWSDIVDHLPHLHDTVCRFPGATVLELGTRAGNSTAAFLAAAEQVGGRVWSIDIARPRIPDWWYDAEFWSLHVGDDMAPDALAFGPAVVDVLFIDTSHGYDHTLAELDAYVPRVRPGGIVLCHDTELEKPEGFESGPDFPVAKALDDFCDAGGFEWTNRTGCNGLGVLEVRNGAR